MFISVDLPAPFSPSSAWISPRRRSKSTESFASTPGNRFVMPRSSRTGVASSIGCGRGRAQCPPPSRLGPWVRRRHLDLALRDQLRDRVDLPRDEGPVLLRDLLAQRCVADAAILHRERRVGVALDAAGALLELLDDVVDARVDLLQRRGEHEGAEEPLVRIDADAPDVGLLRGAEAAEATAACRLEDDAGAARDLVLRRDLALRLVVERRVVRHVQEHLHVLVRLHGTRPEAGEVMHDRRHGVRAHGADDLLALVRVEVDHQARDVPDEVARLLLPEDDAVVVLLPCARVARCADGPVVDVDACEMRAREGRIDLPEVLEEVEADADHEAVSGLRRGLEVREALIRGVRDEDAALDAELALSPLEAEIGEMVEALVVETPDVGHHRNLGGADRLRLRRRPTAERGADRDRRSKRSNTCRKYPA